MADFDALMGHADANADSDAEDNADAALFAKRIADLKAGRRDTRLSPGVTAFLLKCGSLRQALRKTRKKIIF